MKQSLRLF